MGKWTGWRRIMDEDGVYFNKFDHDGPACYELGIGSPLGGRPKPVYAGKTNNEKGRMKSHLRNDSHLSWLIKSFVKKHGKILYYRAQAKPSVGDAENMEESLLKTYKYEWNSLQPGLGEIDGNAWAKRFDKGLVRSRKKR